MNKHQALFPPFILICLECNFSKYKFMSFTVTSEHLIQSSGQIKNI